MPGKKGAFTEKDYQAPLRRPGEKRVNIAQDGGKETSASVSDESEKAESVDVKDTEPDEVKNQALKTSEPTNKITKLSPYATEFVPKVAYNLQPAVDAAKFVSRSSLQQNNRPPLLQQRSNKPDKMLIDYVKVVLFSLMQSPGKLDDLANTLAKKLERQLSTLSSLKKVVDLIFEYSITEPNFQYIAAKLCNLLSKEKGILQKNRIGELFPSVLMDRCRDEHLNRDASLQNPASTTRLFGFAMFEAELFCNYRPLGESQPLEVFKKRLLEMLNTLLQNHSEGCLTCIGKILKMTGFLLDDPQFAKDDKGRKEKVEKIFSDVEKLSKESLQSDSVKSLLSQVIKLRATNWGSGPSDGLPGTYKVLPSDDGYFISGYADDAVGMTYKMPGKKGAFTAKDYQAPLRRPGEKRENLAQDGGKETPASVSDESEKVNPSSEVHVVSDLHVGESASSQVPEEKPVDEGNEQKEPEEKDVEPQKTETDADVPEAKEENDTKSSTAAGSVDVEDTEPDKVKNEDYKTAEPSIKTTKLSPFATEFVPKVAFNLQSAVDAAEFVPRSLMQQNERPPLLQHQSDEPANELMNCVKDVLFGLTQTPGELESYVSTLVKMLKKQQITLVSSMKDVVDLIFEYSITEPNFQYIAAKLCNSLSMEKSIVPQPEDDDNKFRSVLMNRCGDEHRNSVASLQDPASTTRLLGFAMFEAELFCNYRPLGESQPLKVFHRGLLEMLNTLIQNPSEDCLKCIGKMLKMTGFLLDDPNLKKDDKGDRTETVEKVFSDVEKLSKESTQSDSVKDLLSQVINLRATNWGSGPGDGLPGTYKVLPSDDGYFISGYADHALGLDELNLDDDLTPVTNSEQWSEYYDDEEDPTASTDDAYKYYFPDQFTEDISGEIVGGYDEYDPEFDPEFDPEIEEEFEKFLQEQQASFQ